MIDAADYEKNENLCQSAVFEPTRTEKRRYYASRGAAEEEGPTLAFLPSKALVVHCPLNPLDSFLVRRLSDMMTSET